MSVYLISIAAFIGVVALFGAAVGLYREFAGTRTEERLDAFTGQKTSSSRNQGAQVELALREALGSGPGFFERVMDRIGNLSHVFEQAEVSLQPGQFFLISGLLAALGGGTAWWLGAPVGIVPVAMVVMGTLPLVWLIQRRKKRLKKFGAQLPDALELVARALRAGHSLGAGMHVVAEEMPAPIGTEFGRVHEEQNLGISLEDTLLNLTKRVPNLDLKFFATAVVLQRQTGGDLSEILDKIGYVIRERFKIYGQVQALTGEGRLSGIVLMLLPVVLFIAMYQLNPDYIMVLFTEEMGRKMLAVAIFLQILGAIVIKKIVDIKV